GSTVTIQPPASTTTTLATGETAWLSGLQDLATANLPPGLTLFRWSSSPGLGVSGNAPATVSVKGPGTLTAFFGGFALSASLSPTSAIDLGRPITLSAVASGVGTFTYSWTGLPPGCPGGNLPGFRCTPTSVGNYTISVQVNSSDGTVHTAVAGSITIVPALQELAFSASPTNFTLGHPTHLSITTTGGVAPLSYQYSGLPTECPSANLPAMNCTPLSSGRFDVTVRVADAAGLPVFGYTTLNIAPPPSVLQFNQSRTITDVGRPVTWSVWVDGGTSPLHLAYSGLPPGCASQDATLLLCTPTQAGNYSILVTVTDADGIAADAPRSLTVSPALVLSAFSATPSPLAVNGSLHFVVTVGGGTGPFRTAYQGLPLGCSSQNITDWSCTPAVAGNYTVRVSVTDAVGVVVNGSALVTVTTPVPTPVQPNQPSGTPDSTPWFPLLGIAVLALAAVVAIALWRRGRRPAVAEEPDEGGAEGPSASEPAAGPPNDLGDGDLTG
ncbi:MAG: hypothetical protein L3K06_08410, partial [Thermoplasmata archaeon]|nr:hypothetical protein [Thermoplasmata archaeon]